LQRGQIVNLRHKKWQWRLQFYANSKAFIAEVSSSKRRTIQMKPQITTLKTLFRTKQGIENPGKFLINAEIATRKWV
jgi:hypothetical protein